MKKILCFILFCQFLFAENREVFDCLAIDINGHAVELRTSVAQGGLYHPYIFVDKLNTFIVLNLGTNTEITTQFKYIGSSNVEDFVIETYLSSNDQEEVKINVPIKNDKIMKNDKGSYFFVLDGKNKRVTYNCIQKH